MLCRWAVSKCGRFCSPYILGEQIVQAKVASWRKGCKLTMQVKGKGRGNDAPPLSYSFALIPRDAMYRSRRGMAKTSQTMAMDKLILPFSPSMSARLKI